MRTRLFPSLAMTTALLTIGLIVFGAVVRVTDSGLGCGNQWPLCNGTIFPPLDNLTAWIEWLHRLFAALIGVFGLVTLYLAIRAYRKRNRAVLRATVVAAALFIIQSALGAIVVIFDLPPTMVTLHLGTAMLLLAALLVAAIGAFIGTVVGQLPGLGPINGVAILLPLAIALKLPPETALILLAAVYIGCEYGGRISAILINVPGDAAAIMTSIDGYPMVRKGLGGVALSISAWS